MSEAYERALKEVEIADEVLRLVEFQRAAARYRLALLREQLGKKEATHG